MIVLQEAAGDSLYQPFERVHAMEKGLIAQLMISVTSIRRQLEQPAPVTGNRSSGASG